MLELANKGKNMIFNLNEKLCKCGLKFLNVTFIRSRIRGYCSYDCRKNIVMKKRLGKLPRK